jgi:DNA primase
MSYHCRIPYRPQAHNRAQLEVWIENNLDVRNVGREEINCVCPFHQSADTRRPDMYINVEKGVYHCLSSSCGVKGHVLDLIRRLTGGSWEDARRQVGRPGVEALGRLLGALRPQPEAPTLSLSWDEVYAHRSSHYWSTTRGITQAAQDHFMLGFDHSRNQALIPYIDEHREPRCFLRRQMFGHPKYLYPEQFEAERAWYHLYECRPDQPLIVVEGSIDAMRVWEAGFTNVIAILGSETPPDKGRMIRHYQVISFLDADPAGVQGTWKLRRAVGRLIQRVSYPDELQGSDPGSLTNEQISTCLGRLVPVI